MFDLSELIARSIERSRHLESSGIYFLGEVTDQAAEHMGQALTSMAVQREGDPSQPITVYINSGGGAIGAGLAMMQMIYRLRTLYGVTINTVVTGYAYSMGAIIFQAGDKRLMGSFSTLMLHSPQWQLTGDEEKVFHDYGLLARHYKNLISNIFAQRSGKHDPDWWGKYIYSGRDRFLTAQECIEMGLADEIYGLQLTSPPPPTEGEANLEL
ncbi:MAG: ATP-dependent Clp protease proteolytic subunit [Chloroflexota bacterium]|jgi:ATP-dependent Clp endopeptidase proteolytic subunit ClpP|nr:ATP-dependent Clp protease proteolytic subunit [Chloroflexota bacterium]